MAEQYRNDQPGYSYGSGNSKLSKLHKLAIQRYLSISSNDTRDLMIIERVEILLALSFTMFTIGKILSGELELTEEGKAVKNIDNASLMTVNNESHVDDQKRNWIPMPKFKVGQTVRFITEPHEEFSIDLVSFVYSAGKPTWRYWAFKMVNGSQCFLNPTSNGYELDLELVQCS